MREILFRGKADAKWVYGVPVKGTGEDESEILIIESVFKCDEYACRGCEFAPVIPSTVGLMQKKEYVLLSAVIVNTSGLLKQEIMKKLH